jgi:5'-3' exonuclease
MGIPSFFSYIIKQHNKNVLYNNVENISFHYLFIDANSIIYDVYNKSLQIATGGNIGDFELFIIDNVGLSLEKLIEHINPTIKTYIAFDGICPFAKMKHQRNRRLKSYILKELPSVSKGSNNINWDTTNITPGTAFMQKLTKQLKKKFFNNSNVFFSGADIIGEGESKICKYIRDIFKNNKSENLPTIAFYGLDNDIIMLSILHLHYSENIFVFREEQNTNTSPETNTPTSPVFIYIDIKSLTNSILYEMKCIDLNYRRVIDYVFLCFFLGNDFLPKFPSLQIRTNGISILLDTYRENIGNFTDRYLIDPIKECINWKWVSIFINKLAVNENNFIIIETEIRDKMEKSLRYNNYKTNDIMALENPENMPILYRETEKYICPKELGWEWRYYKGLFDTIPTQELKKKWCLNYLEGLEWTFRYYTGDCPDWKWSFCNEYPPLLQDLMLWIPNNFNWVFFPSNNYNPYNNEEQLKYVMPPQIDNKKQLIKNINWKWAYCRYLWESHVTIIDHNCHNNL